MEYLAHEIRAGKSRRRKAVCALRGKRRWAMTGTPIQNRWEDLASLLLFIRAYPDEDLRALKRMLSRGAHDMFAKSMLTSICLRRPKALISLPPRTDEVHKLDFDDDEAVHYNTANAAVIGYLTHIATTQNVGMATNMLAKINTLRQICNIGLHYKTPLTSHAKACKASMQEQFEGLVASGMAICSCCSNDLTQGEGSTFSALSEFTEFDTSTSWISMCGETILCSTCFNDSQTESPSMKQSCNHQPWCELVKIASNPQSEVILRSSPVKLPAKLRALQKGLLNLPKNDKRLDPISSPDFY